MAGEILIDTSALIDFFEDKMAPETERLIINRELAMSVITFGEFYKFLLKIGRTSKWPEYKERLSKYRLIDVTKEISEKAASFSYIYGLSFADSLIYATARLNELELLTSDSKDFKGKKGVIISGRK